MSGPPAGIRVVEGAIAVRGPLATQILGDMGAEIIKLETPDGDPTRQIGPDCPELGEDPRFSTISGRTENIDALHTIVAERMRQRTTSAWRVRLDRLDVPNGVVNDLAGLVADPYLNATGFFQPVEQKSEGTLLTTAVPVGFSETPGAVHLPPPRLDEHTAELLGELGYGPAQIAEIAGG